MRKCVWFFIILFSQSNFASPHIYKDSSFQSLLDELRASNKITSVTLTISYPNQKQPDIFLSGHVDENSTEAVTDENLFQIGSITKSFIASLIIKLKSQGKVSLDDSLTQYLPQYPAWNGITIRQLLNHTSGIYNYTDSLAFRQAIFSQPYQYLDANTLLRFAESEPLYFKPGSGWHYSNTNYVLLGKIIEVITSQPFNQVLAEQLLNHPALYLNSTFFVSHTYSNEIKNRMLHGYYVLDRNQVLDITDYSMSWLNSAGGLVSNGRDITTWLRALFTGKVFTKSEWDEFTQLVSITDGHPIDKVSEANPEGYAFGIRAKKTTWENLPVIWWHSGGTLGYKSLMM